VRCENEAFELAERFTHPMATDPRCSPLR
jgi:hypothetical protein